MDGAATKVDAGRAELDVRYRYLGSQCERYWACLCVCVCVCVCVRVCVYIMYIVYKGFV